MSEDWTKDFLDDDYPNEGNKCSEARVISLILNTRKIACVLSIRLESKIEKVIEDQFRFLERE